MEIQIRTSIQCHYSAFWQIKWKIQTLLSVGDNMVKTEFSYTADRGVH